MSHIKEERYSDGKGRKKHPSDSSEKKREYHLKYKAKDIEGFKKLAKDRDEKWKQKDPENYRKLSRIRAKKWRENNPKQYAETQKRFQKKHKDRLRARKSPKERASDLVGTARRRSKVKGFAFDLDKKDIEKAIERGVCEVTGCPFVLREGRNMFAPSLDRKNGELGYIRSNVRVVVWCYNTAKNIGTDEDVITMARYLLQRVDGGQV